MDYTVTLEIIGIGDALRRASATADNDFRYLISSGLKVPPPLVILIPYTRWKLIAHPP